MMSESQENNPSNMENKENSDLVEAKVEGDEAIGDETDSATKQNPIAVEVATEALEEENNDNHTGDNVDGEKLSSEKQGDEQEKIEGQKEESNNTCSIANKKEEQSNDGGAIKETITATVDVDGEQKEDIGDQDESDKKKQLAANAKEGNDDIKANEDDNIKSKSVSVGTSTINPITETQEVSSSTKTDEPTATHNNNHHNGSNHRHSHNNQMSKSSMRNNPSRRSSYTNARHGYMGGGGGGYQNYGLTYLPYKSNFEPSENARRKADEFLKTLKL